MLAFQLRRSFSASAGRKSSAAFAPHLRRIIKLDWLSWWRGHRRYLITGASITVAYFFGGRLGLALPLTRGNLSPIWAPAGLAVAALLLFGRRFWPAVALGAFLVNFFSTIPHTAALAIACGNTLGPLLGVTVLRRVSGFQATLNRFRDLLALSIISGLFGTAVSASVGTSALFLSGVRPWGEFGVAWLVWWLGDAMGVLILAPLALTFPGLFTIAKQGWIEFGVLLSSGALVCALMFEGGIGLATGAAVFALALLPFLLWSAMRFELPGTSTVNLVIAAIIIAETARGRGPLARADALWSVTLLQSFLAFIVVLSMALAAVVADRSRLIREKAAQMAVQQSERRYGGILETSNQGVWMLDPQFRTQFIHPATAALLGYGVEEMLGRSLLDFVFPEEIARKRADLERYRRGIRCDVENRYLKKDGSELRVRVATAPIFDPDGTFGGAVKWLTPVNDQAANDMDPRSAVEMIVLLSRAVQQTADSIMITDNTGIIEYVNSAFEAITGFSQQEAVGRTPRIVKSGRQGAEFYKKLWDCIAEGKPFRGTLVNRKKSGEMYWGEQTITPVVDETGRITHFVSVVRDVTDSLKRHEQETQLRLAREVQQRFYNASITAAGLDIAAAAHPADETGGDYFDLIPTPDAGVYVGIGDVSGHGFGSALVMALMRAYIRSFAELQLGVGEILTRLNRMLMGDLEHGQFATLALVRVAPDRRSLTYANAGHVPPLLLNHCGRVERYFESTGIPLGLFDSSKYSEVESPLWPGQMLLLVTDGVAECAADDDSEFGVDRISEYMSAHCEQSASELVQGLFRAAREFAGEEGQRDDLTSVVVKVCDQQPLGAGQAHSDAA